MWSWIDDFDRCRDCFCGGEGRKGERKYADNGEIGTFVLDFIRDGEDIETLLKLLNF